MNSITEELETAGGGNSSTAEPSLGMRNNLVRSSKEILKTHKVPFPGFKKKDKDKEKEKNVSKCTMVLKRVLVPIPIMRSPAGPV